MDIDALKRRVTTLERELQEHANPRTGLPLPGTFDGTTDFYNYLKSFNLVATAHGWNPARCVQILPLYLRGSAKAIYDGLDQNVKTNWKDLVDGLADKLKKVSSGLMARQKLAQRRQFAGETLDEFAQEIRSLVAKAYPDNTLEMDLATLALGDRENEVKEENAKRIQQFRSEIARDFFRANMLPEIKERVMYMEEPQNLMEALTQAKRVEQIQGSLANDQWRMVQSTKAEVAMAEVNAVRAEFQEFRDQQKTQNDQRFSATQPGGGPHNPNYFQNSHQNSFNYRGQQNTEQFGGRLRQQFGQNNFRGRNNFRGSNFTPLGNRSSRQNGGDFRPNFDRNRNEQNWRGRGGGNSYGGRGGGNQERGRSGWRVNEVNFPFICFIAIISAILVPATGQYQICPTQPTEGITVTMNFPEEQNCTLPVETPPLTVKSNLYIPIRIPRVFPAFKCWNITTIACTESFLRVITLDHPDKKIETEASVEDCQASLHHLPMNRVSETRWESLSPIQREYGWYGVNCFDNVQTIVEEGTAGILEGRRLITSWGDSLKVDKSLGEEGSWIRLPGAMELLMWRIPSEEFWHSHFAIGPVVTEIWPNKAVVVDELQYTFPISKNQERKFPVIGVPNDALKTENNVYVHVIGKVNSTKISRARRDANPKKSNVPRANPTKKPNIRRNQNDGLPSNSSISTMAIPTTKIPTTAIPTTTIPATTTKIPTTAIPTTTIPATTTKIPTTAIPTITIPATTTKILTTAIPTTRIPATTIRSSSALATPQSPTDTTNNIPATLKELNELAQQITNDDVLSHSAPTPFIIQNEPSEESPTTVITKREVSESNEDGSEKFWKEKNLDHENSRLSYLGWKTHRVNIQNAREKWISDCHERNNALAIAKALARQMPEDAARSLYKRDDITAFWTQPSREQKWSIALCRQMKAEEVFWDQKVETKCFRELPVKVTRQILFVKPGTRDLTYIGTEISCDAQGNNPWAAEHSNNNSELNNANLGHRFITDQYSNAQNPLIFFNRGSIFESEQARLERNLKELTERITRPELDFPEIGTIDANQTEVHGIPVTGIFSIGEILVEKMRNEGESLRRKAEETIEKGKTWIEDPIGIIKYVKWIGFSILIVLIAVGSCFIFGKIKIYGTILTIPLHMIGTLTQMLMDCFTSGRNVVERVRHPVVMEVELQPFSKPSAPPEEPALEQTAYILNYLPKICQIHHYQRRKKRCYVNVLINGKDIKALFDTGADVTYIELSTAKKYGLSILRGDFPQARAANSTSINFIGSALTNVKFGEFEGKFPILISEDGGCPCAAIIGTDFMDFISEQGGEEEIGLNFKQGIVRVGHVQLPMVGAVNIECRPIEVRLLQTHTLPPLSDSFVWGRINRNLSPEDTFITAEREHDYFPMRVGKCLTSPGATRIVPLRLLNFGNCDIKVHGGSRLAVLEPISADTHINSLKKCTETEENMLMNDEEWSKFKAESDQIPPEADWTDETLAFPKEDEATKPILERISLRESILSPGGMIKLRQIIETNEQAFVKPGEVGLFKGKTIHRIDLTEGARPCQQRPYRYPVALQPEIERQVKELLRQNVIRPSSSAWASPIVLVRKPDGSYRFCVDYRKLNQLTKRSTYYLPRIQSILDEVTGKKYFSVADCSSGFFHIKLAKGHEERSAFICHMGLFEWLRCPFGLAGAPTTFQRAMEEVRQMCSATFLVYLDDCIIGSMTEAEHLRDIDIFLKTMAEVGFRLKPEKCRFALGEIRYLGHLISEKGVRIDPKDLEPIQRLKKPANITELRSLIGMLSYFRKFIFGFAEILQPIYELTKNENTTEWGQIHENALEELKQRLMTAPVLAPPKFGNPFVVETDASTKAIAGCLLQENRDGEVHPISYFSRVLTKHEKRYSVVELEALAICASLKNFRPYLEGAGKSTVITDNSALTSLFRRKDLEGRLSRYQLAIMAFDVDIIHRPGSKNKFCDHLSRYLEENVKPQINWLSVEAKTSQSEMVEAQKRDAELQKIIMRLKTNVDGEESNENEKRGWKLFDELLCIMDKGEWKICVPKSLRSKIMGEYHSDPFQGAHLGEKRTREKIRRSLFWEGLDGDVQRFVKTCDACQRRKIIGIQMSAEPICPIEPASRPCERLHLDLIGPLKTAKGGFQYILMIVDSFSKYMMAIPLREQSATTVTAVFVDKFLCLFGLPKIVVTDCGTQFLSTTFESLAKIWGFKHQTSLPYHQSANGQVERYNRTLADMLVTTTGGNNWASALPMICFAYNSSTNSQIEQTPFFVMHGFDPKMPSELALGTDDKKFSDMAIFVSDLTVRMTEIRQKVNEKLRKCAVQMKKQQKRINEIPWTEGMLVLLRKVDKKHKLEPNYEGPYRVIGIEKPNLLLKKLNPDDTEFEAHMDRCKPYFQREVEERNEPGNEIKTRALGDPNLEESDDESEDKKTAIAFLRTSDTDEESTNDAFDEPLFLMEIQIDGNTILAYIDFSENYEPSIIPRNRVQAHWEIYSGGQKPYITAWLFEEELQIFVEEGTDRPYIGSEMKRLLRQNGIITAENDMAMFWNSIGKRGQIWEEMIMPIVEVTHRDSWDFDLENAQINCLKLNENEKFTNEEEIFSTNNFHPCSHNPHLFSNFDRSFPYTTYNLDKITAILQQKYLLSHQMSRHEAFIPEKVRQSRDQSSPTPPPIFQPQCAHAIYYSKRAQ